MRLDYSKINCWFQARILRLQPQLSWTCHFNSPVTPIHLSHLSAADGRRARKGCSVIWMQPTMEGHKIQRLQWLLYLNPLPVGAVPEDRAQTHGTGRRIAGWRVYRVVWNTVRKARAAAQGRGWRKQRCSDCVVSCCTSQTASPSQPTRTLSFMNKCE